MILALDLGTSTGFAYGVGDSLPHVGNVRMPTTGDDVGAFLAFFRDWFVPTARRLEPRLVAFEAPILPMPKVSIDWSKRPPKPKIEMQTNIMTTRKLQSLAGVLELMCADLKIPCFEVQLNTAKKELTGHGHAEKADMLRVARAQGLDLSTGREAFDEADAFAAWLVAIRYHAKEFVPYWDQRLWGRR